VPAPQHNFGRILFASLRLDLLSLIPSPHSGGGLIGSRPGTNQNAISIFVELRPITRRPALTENLPDVGSHQIKAARIIEASSDLPPSLGALVVLPDRTPNPPDSWKVVE